METAASTPAPDGASPGPPGVSAAAFGRAADRFDTDVALDRLQRLQEAGAYPRDFGRPLGFQLELTTACNLRCLHCYNRSGGGGRRGLTFADWERVADEIAALEPFQVILSGGEPLLLGERLFSLMDRLDREPTRFVLISNGMCATPEVVARLAGYRYYWLQISIDGFTAAQHDAFRGVAGSWNRAVRAAQAITAHGQPLVVAHTVHPGNLDTLPSMVDLAAVLGAARIICDAAMPVGMAHEHRARLALDAAQVEAMARVLADKANEYRGCMEVLRTSDIASSFELYRRSPCSVLLIRPNGDVKLDCVLPYVIGNVAEEGLGAIWERLGRRAWTHPRIRTFVGAYQRRGDFADCEARPYVDPDIRLDEAVPAVGAPS